MRHLPIFSALCLSIFLSGCGTFAYKPTEYKLRDGLIPPMVVKGKTKITNAQTDTGTVIVYSYGGSKLSSDLHSITETMVKQTRKELAKAEKPESGSPKTISIKVNSLLSEYAGFHWDSHLNFDAKLGNGEVISMTVPHASGILRQDLNGCIAESVMKFLNDPRVRKYLAQ